MSAIVGTDGAVVVVTIRNGRNVVVVASLPLQHTSTAVSALMRLLCSRRLLFHRNMSAGTAAAAAAAAVLVKAFAHNRFNAPSDRRSDRVAASSTVNATANSHRSRFTTSRSSDAAMTSTSDTLSHGALVTL